ncbi:tRNA lysidine(34) synthetase TilS [Reyranella sp.]|uniref:tRNA lysidine(34) synthetase TilS n=1 Tax=Reyranella sp. TaxID=1929291 RepID=UPI001203F388|nr:tRNA lysidine(34) synthetase TilS [Reyranella sp.]TAJ84789.1 MAG: tRNA lysidine(34) synthetase TilS [Reyranella sp.]
MSDEAIASPPVDGPEFARLMASFAPFEARPELAVAVSGGRDSLCLALLADQWARERGGKAIAFIVDHGLRSEAAREAAATCQLLAGQAIESRVLHWTGPKPETGLQQAAREARYSLLRDACRRQGLLHLLVAHQADDQAETVAMRAARQSGADGLAGMAALLEWPDVRLLRPLLAVPRSRLSATLQARRIAWIDDPSNVDPRFERARLRAAGVVAPDLPAVDGQRADEEAQVAEAGVVLLELDREGAVALDRVGFVQIPAGLQRRLVSRIVQALGGGDHPPRRDRLDRAMARLSSTPARGKSGRSQDFTLSGCRFLLRQAETSRRLLWIVCPENGRKGGQPLIPAAFFACGSVDTTHLGNSPT